MKTSRTVVASVIAERALKAGRSRKFTKEVAAYLLENRRVSELESILRDVQLEWAKSGRVEAVASSAHPISATAKKQLSDIARKIYPQAKTVNIEESYDPQLIGGIRFSLTGQQLDLSLQSKLNQFKQLVESRKD